MTKASLYNHKSKCKGIQHVGIQYSRNCDVCCKTYNCRQTFSYYKKSYSDILILPVVTSCSNSLMSSVVNSCSNSLIPSVVELSQCSLSFSDTQSLTQHQVSNTKLRSLQYNCTFDDYPKSFNVYKTLDNHVTVDHKADLIKYLTFDSVNHFQEWLELEGSSTFTSFKKCTGTKLHKNSKYYYYSCQFGKNVSKFQPITSRKNNKGTIPKNVHCPVQIHVIEKFDNLVSDFINKYSANCSSFVDYCRTNYHNRSEL